jgi:hypothetical protein
MIASSASNLANRAGGGGDDTRAVLVQPKTILADALAGAAACERWGFRV